MLFWSKRSTAPSADACSEACAFARRSLRSFAKSIRCSQSTAIVAPREAIFMDGLLPRLPPAQQRTGVHQRQTASASGDVTTRGDHTKEVRRVQTSARKIRALVARRTELTDRYL